MISLYNHMKKLLLTYHGRITRAQFWTAHLIIMLCVGFIFLFSSSLITIVLALHEKGLISETMAWSMAGMSVAIPMLLSFIFIGLSLFNVYVKRLHDLDKSEMYLFILAIPILGAIGLIVALGFLKGTIAPNTYGDDPRNADA